MSSTFTERIPSLLARLVRLFIAGQFWLSASFDRLLPKRFRIDGHKSFRNEVVWGYLRPGMWIYDVGGGKHPFIDPERKDLLGLRVTGLDADAGELAHAPAGCYDDISCCDIAEYFGRGNADFVICQATLEHVRDNTRAMAAVASIVRPEGQAAIFAPSRYAAYARLHALLPDRVTRKILDFVYPSGRGSHGFRAYYDKCSIRELSALGHQNGLEVLSIHRYYCSNYFGIFFPAYVLWRLWLLLNYAMDRDRAAETFAIIFRKPAKVGYEHLSPGNRCLGA
jgi:2-polyprenyl-3-methyl-5-hydroxy-6-metoxy-1,4-benzoquinol methylase